MLINSILNIKYELINLYYIITTHVLTAYYVIVLHTRIHHRGKESFITNKTFFT